MERRQLSSAVSTRLGSSSVTKNVSKFSCHHQHGRTGLVPRLAETALNENSGAALVCERQYVCLIPVHDL